MEAQIDLIHKHTDTLILKTKIAGQYAYFETDKLGEIYLISNESNTITNQDLTLKYSNENIGDVQSIDPANPFSLLLFYKDYQQLKILDRTFSEIGQIVLGDIGIWNAAAVCRSNSNDIWVWDETSFQLKKITSQGHLITESRDLRQVLETPIHFTQLQSRKDKLYALDKEEGIYIFDTAGQFYDLVPINGVNDFHIHQNKLFYIQSGSLYYYHLKNKITKKIGISIQKIEQVRITTKGIYLLQAGQLSLFQQN